jgi:hypothetical protein
MTEPENFEDDLFDDLYAIARSKHLPNKPSLISQLATTTKHLQRPQPPQSPPLPALKLPLPQSSLRATKAVVTMESTQSLARTHT